MTGQRGNVKLELVLGAPIDKKTIIIDKKTNDMVIHNLHAILRDSEEDSVGARVLAIRG